MKRLITACLLTSISLLGNSQTDSSTYWLKVFVDTTANFYEIVSHQEKYFNNHPDTTATEDGIRTEFYRWENFWRNRVDNSKGFNGNIYNAIKKYYSVFNNLDQYLTKNQEPSADWQN